MKNFRLYKKIKNKFQFLKYNDYPLDRVLGSYIALNVYGGGWKYLFKVFFSNVSINIKNDKVLITYSTERSDYKDLMKGYFPDSNYQSLVDDNRVSIYSIILKNMFSVIHSIFLCFLYLVKNRALFKFNVKEFLLISFSIRVINYLECKNIECDKYIAFNSSYKLESFLSFYFKKRGIPTYTLQHGMYFDYPENNIPKDVINYENICADNIFCWGEFSLKVINKFKPRETKVILVGNPLVQPARKDKCANSDKVYVLLPRALYLKEAIKLLSILPDKFGYIIRPHPSMKNDVISFIRDKKNMEIDTYTSAYKLLQSVSFKAVIAFNSTMVFLAIHENQRVFYYADNSEINLEGFNTFDSEENLIDLFEHHHPLSDRRSYYAPFKAIAL